MDADSLFLETLKDLETRIQPGCSEYEVLQIAKLLRQLLLDGSRLTDQVNRRHRVKVRFRANAGGVPDGTPAGLIFWAIQDGLDPETARPRPDPPLEMTRDEFLSTIILRVQAEDLTVGDVISYLANIGGAVHLGQPKTAKEQALAMVGQSVNVGGYPAEVRSLLSVARVALKALSPLRAAVASAAR